MKRDFFVMKVVLTEEVLNPSRQMVMFSAGFHRDSTFWKAFGLLGGGRVIMSIAEKIEFGRRLLVTLLEGDSSAARRIRAEFNYVHKILYIVQ